MAKLKTKKSIKRSRKTKTSLLTWMGLTSKGSKNTNTGLWSRAPIAGKLALLVAVISVVGGYALLTQSFAATSGTPEVASGYTGKCLDDFKNSTANRAVVDLFTCNGTTAQQWAWSGQQIMLKGKCLDVQGAKTDNGRIVELFSCNGGSNQKWKSVGGNLVGVGSNKCLNAPDSRNGFQLQIWTCSTRTSESWVFTNYVKPTTVTSGGGSGGGGVTEIASGYSPKCLDDFRNSTANGAIVDLFTCNGTTAQQAAWNGQQIMLKGKCLDVQSAKTDNGRIVDLYTCNGGSNQKWKAVNGTLVGVGSNRCLNAPASTNGTQLQIWDCKGLTSEKWAFTHYAANTAPPVTTQASTPVPSVGEFNGLQSSDPNAATNFFQQNSGD